VPHVHVHVIPRYAGDMPDPRGGVRHVIPESDQGELCLESETVELLRQVHDHAVEGDIAWLKTKGKVYQFVDAA
jgi:hypothetical protein